MLEFLGQRCTNALIKRGVIQQKEYPIYQYGFELLWSTVLCVMSILLLSMVFDYTRCAIVFLLYFLPIRTVAGGYHAPSYEKCFILTNLVAVGCIAIAKTIGILYVPHAIIILVGGIVFGCLWVNAPAVAEDCDARKETPETNKRYSRIIIISEVVAVALMMIFGQREGYYTAIVTSIVVVYMMRLAKWKED